MSTILLNGTPINVGGQFPRVADTAHSFMLVDTNLQDVALSKYWGQRKMIGVIPSIDAAIGLGTMFGGWRIVKTMGQKITKLKPVGGFCAETGGALTLFVATFLGVPVSTTHTITGAIVGVGSTQRASAVRWGVAGNIVWAWLLTIPASAFVASIAYWISLQLY